MVNDTTKVPIDHQWEIGDAKSMDDVIMVIAPASCHAVNFRSHRKRIA